MGRVVRIAPDGDPARVLEIYDRKPTGYFRCSRGQFYRQTLRVANEFEVNVESVRRIWQRRNYKSILDLHRPINQEDES